MPADSKNLEAFQKAIGEHAFVSEFVENLNQTAALLSEPDAAQKIAGIKVFLQKHVVEHFRFEEERVFPAFLGPGQVVPALAWVTELQQEHAVLLVEAEKLNALLAAPNLAGDATVMHRLDQAFRGFLGRIQHHAAKEDNIFLAMKFGTK